jgi:hypothetical protein
MSLSPMGAIIFFLLQSVPTFSEKGVINKYIMCDMEFKPTSETMSSSSEVAPIIIGLDVGGVLSILNGEDHDAKINMPDAIEMLQKLVSSSLDLSEKNTLQPRKYVFKIISYCGYLRAVRTKDILMAYPHLFTEMYFVKSREYKAQLCKHLGCHIMVDDRETILNNVLKQNPSIQTIIFGEKTQGKTKHKIAKDWKELFDLIENYQYVPVFPNPSIEISDLIHDV